MSLFDSYRGGNYPPETVLELIWNLIAKQTRKRPFSKTHARAIVNPKAYTLNPKA